MGTAEFLESFSGVPPRAGTPDPGQAFVGSLEPSGVWGSIMQSLDYLQRPMRGVSEAVGAYSEGEDPLEAAMRGLQGRYHYGTLGEQLIPKTVGSDYDPAEEFYKSAGRLAIDIAGDPLTWATLGPGRAVVGAGIRGAEKLGAAAQKAPLVGKYLKIPQSLAQIVLPSVSFLRRYGGRWGGKAAQSVDRMYVNSRTATAKVEKELLDVLDRFGLTGRGDESLRIAAAEHVRSGALRQGIRHADDRVQGLAQWIDDAFKRFGDEAEGFVDRDGFGLTVASPRLASLQKSMVKKARKMGLMGPKHAVWRDEAWDAYRAGLEPLGHWSDAQKGWYREMRRKLDKMGFQFDATSKSIWKKGFQDQPFKKLEDYIPQMLSDEGLIKLMSDKDAFSKVARQMAKANGITVMKAEEILRNFAVPKKAGNIEYARHTLIPEEFLEMDPLKFMPRYFEKAYNRMEFGREFRLDGRRLDGLLEGAVRHAGLSKRWADSFRDIAMGRAPRDFGLDNLARKIMGFQVMTKMGPLSSLANLSQNANTIVKEGGVNFLKGVLRAQTDEGARAGVVAYQRGIHDALMRLAGGQSTWANRYLTWVGFTPVEKMNRLLAANAGIVSTENAIRALGSNIPRKLPEALRKLGLTHDDIVSVVNNNFKLTDDIADRVGFLASEATQHATHWKDIPLYWQRPEFRMMLQYKSFIYQQTRFLMREVMNPAIKYFKTNGREGRIGPLVRAAATFGIGAEAVNGIREAVRAGVGKVTGLEYEPREFDSDHPIWQLFEHSMYVGGLGIAGDLVDRAARRDLKGWLLGPTIGDVSDVVEGAVGTVYKREAGDPLPYHMLTKELMRRVPGLGTLLPRGRATTAQVEEWFDALR